MTIWRLVAALVCTTVVTGCSSGGDESSTAGTELSPSTSPSTSTSQPPPLPPTSASGDSDLMTLPDAVGMDLQAAQDAMQAAGFYILRSHDATGQDRFQVSDSNWTVCDQSPPGGSQASADTTIDFGAVKDDESCL